MQQVVYLLQGLGFTPTFNNSKPHLRMKGREQLLRLEDWLGAKGAKLQSYFANSRRIVSSKTFKLIGASTEHRRELLKGLLRGDVRVTRQSV